MEDRVDLNDAFAGAPEEHAPITNPEAKTLSRSQGFDVAHTGFCVPLYPGDDAPARSAVNVSKVAERPS